MDQELKYVYYEVKKFLEKNKIEHKELFYKYRIEIFMANLNIEIRTKNFIEDDYVDIFIKNTKTRKTDSRHIRYSFFDSLNIQEVVNNLITSNWINEV